MKNVRAIMAAVLVLSACYAAAAASPTAAATCSPHCYGNAEMDRTTHGGTIDMRVTCLSVTNPSSQFVDEEFWVSTGSASSNNWVEEGMTYGTPTTSRKWFWADNRPGSGGYHEHYPTHSADLNTTYILTIAYAGNSSWYVYEHGGTPLGTSTKNNTSSPFLFVGEEITDTTAKGAAVHSSLYYKDTSDNFHASWPGSYIANSDNPPTAGWISQSNSMRAYSNCAAPSTATTTSRRGAVSPTGEAKVSTLTTILDAARNVARQNGVPNPSDVRYVRTSRGAINRLDGNATVDTNPSVVAVTMSGAFIGRIAKVPPHALLPTGRYLTAVYDAATGELTDWSITPTAPDLAALGTVTSLR